LTPRIRESGQWAASDWHSTRVAASRATVWSDQAS
jgi:hypothetical protein